MIAFLHKCWTGIVIAGVILLFFCWAVGYFANGLFNTKFDLNSVWAGIAAISTAGVVGLGKYLTDSAFNSPAGTMPEERRDKNESNNAERHPDNG